MYDYLDLDPVGLVDGGTVMYDYLDLDPVGLVDGG
jgi:hypothetical protein